jgi:2,4-dienoyl-CoA reductase-like NADH-dependent reductase (Old Yellow Enzyme family)/pimeloyl-ACP methyl ester carboxylesterase
MGGRTCYYDGTVTGAWQRFEKRFAEAGVGGIISATMTVDDRRWSPLEYPKLTDRRFVEPLRRGIQAVQDRGECKYIIQLGDHGSHTQASLFSQEEDSKSASPGFDLLFGYRNYVSEMTVAEIQRTVQNFARSAALVRETGCDGLEITASKGYLIHQFLNPLTNRRTDNYGKTEEKRFQFLREIVEAVRKTVGKDFLLGIRLSAVDFNYLPLNIRWPVGRSWRHYFTGNGLKETLYYGQELKNLGVDYLHISSGFGFINPKESTGAWPVDAFRQAANSIRHLSAKAGIRAMLLNGLPRPVLCAIAGAGWRYVPANNLQYAREFKEKVGLPVIANGGFESRNDIENALASGACDLVSMARPLLANPDLPSLLERDKEPFKPCTHCNRCSVLTAVQPLGCYDRSRFPSLQAMEDQILWWSGGDSAETSPLRRSQIDIGGVRSFRIEASPQGQERSEEAVVFVHGNPGSSEDWVDLVKRVGNFARAVAFDNPGFGQSDKPENFDYTVQGYADFLGKGLQELGITKAHLVLHDFGGPFGLAWAARNPDNFASVVLINAPPVSDYRWYFLAKVWRTPLAGELLHLFVPRWFFRLVVEWGCPQRLPDEFIARMWYDYDRGTRDAVLKLYRATDARAMVPAPPSFFRQLNRPALILWGQPDVYMPARFAEQHRESFPEAPLIYISQDGHWPFILNSEKVGLVLSAFLQCRMKATNRKMTEEELAVVLGQISDRSESTKRDSARLHSARQTDGEHLH